MSVTNKAANGWHISESGTGSDGAYASGAVYTGNVSRTFYAQFVDVARTEYTITWVVGDNVYGVPTSVAVGGKILLPNVDDIYTEEGMYITAWKTTASTTYSPSESYQWGMTADQDYTFYAQLSPASAGSVTYQFKDSTGTLIHSVTIGQGAEGYMALSGLSQSALSSYNFAAWANQKANTSLTSSGNYTFAAIGVPGGLNDTDNNNGDMGAVGVVLIIVGVLGLGAVGFFLLKRRGVFAHIGAKFGKSKGTSFDEEEDN
jgi:hypothetical protein